MVRQADRRAATRARILESATALFAARGFDATSTEAILEAAGISRGALYHHFDTKQAIFEAVFRETSDQAIARAMRGAPTSPAKTSPSKTSHSPLEALVEVCLRWLREVRKPAVGALLLEQGPQVLGWKRARDLEAETSLGLMVRSLEQAQAAGELAVDSPELAARFLNAVLAEAALSARHRRPRLTNAALERSFRQVVDGFRCPPRSTPED